MNYLDVVITIPILWGIYKGFRKGLVIELASLIGLFLGVWSGLKFSSFSAAYLNQFFNISQDLMPLISFSITFIVVVVAIFTLAKLIQKFLKLIALGTLNRLAGALFGGLKFFLIISVIFHLVNSLNTRAPFLNQDLIEKSFLYEPMNNFSIIILPKLKSLYSESGIDTIL